MTDKIQQTIERTAALLDLAASLIFIALLLKVYSWMGNMFDNGLIK